MSMVRQDFNDKGESVVLFLLFAKSLLQDLAESASVSSQI